MASLATAAEVLLVLGEKATEKSSKRRHRKASKMEKTQTTERKVPGRCVSTPGSGLLYEKRESIQRMHGLWLSDSLWEEPRGLVSILRQSGGLRRTHVSHTQLQSAPPPWLLPHPQRLPGPSSLGSPVADSPHTGPNYERFRYERPSLQ